MASFFTYFTSAIGTLVISSFLLSLMLQRHLSLGYFGLIGFPLIALCYAITRKMMAPESANESLQIANKASETKKHPLYPKFVSDDPERQYLYKEVLPGAFRSWLDEQNRSTKSSEDDR